MLNACIYLTKKSSIHGKGLITIQLISQGEMIWSPEPDALIVPIEKIQTWHKDKQKSFHDFAFQCSASEFMYCQGIEKYMNHSCDPNSWWSTDLALIAYRDIFPNEEITYDYTTTDILLKYHRNCQCGSKYCRRKIGNNDFLDLAWQRKYKENLPKHVLLAIEKTRGGNRNEYMGI